MEMEQKKSPEWLQTWLNLPFYDEHEKCSIHIKQYKTFFCTKCMEAPICEYCFKDSKHHNNNNNNNNRHQVLSVTRASGRTGIVLDKIKDIIDEVSEIQTYVINRKVIIYLNPNIGAPETSKKPYCQTCLRKLMKKGYKYCSIACKIHRNEGHDIEIDNNYDETVQAIDNWAGSRKLGEKVIDQCCVDSERKSRRKGIPCRAAFY